MNDLFNVMVVSGLTIFALSVGAVVLSMALMGAAKRGDDMAEAERRATYRRGRLRVIPGGKE